MGKTPAKFENWPDRPIDLASGGPKGPKIPDCVNISNSTCPLLVTLLLFLAYKQVIVWSIILPNFEKIGPGVWAKWGGQIWKKMGKNAHFFQ